MRTLEPKMFKGERVIYTTGHHWVYVFRAFFPLLLVLILGSIAWSFMPTPITSIMIIVALIASFVWVGLKVFDTVIKKAYVTNKRLIYRTGWTQRDTVDVTLDRIGGIKMDQDLWQRFFGYGTVQVIVPVVVIILPRFLRNPIDFRNALYMKAAEAAMPEKPDDDAIAEEEARVAHEREVEDGQGIQHETVPLSTYQSLALESEAGTQLGADLGADMGSNIETLVEADLDAGADDLADVSADVDAGGDGDET